MREDKRSLFMVEMAEDFARAQKIQTLKAENLCLELRLAAITLNSQICKSMFPQNNFKLIHA